MSKLVLVFTLLFSFHSLAEDNKYCEMPISASGENTLDEKQLLLRTGRCSSYDQCVLSCIRAQCGLNVGGGCEHICAIRAIRDETLREKRLQEMAKKYYIKEQGGGCKYNAS